jgi:hypothetical protein
MEPIDHATLIELLRANSSLRVCACAQKNGWRLVLRHREVEWTLVDAHNTARVFASLNEVGAHLRGIAVSDFVVDVDVTDPATCDAELQQRLSEAKQAAEHGERIRRQMLEALEAPRSSVPPALRKD